MSKKPLPLVEGEARLGVFPKYLDNFFAKFENALYNKAQEWDSNYTGGMWEFVDFGNCFFLYPAEDREYTAVTCYDTVSVNRETFGLALTMLMLNHTVWFLHDKGPEHEKLARKLDDQFNRLRTKAYASKGLDKIDVAKLYQILD